MAIRTVITRGYGNGTFNGTIGEVVTRGYSIGEALQVYTNIPLSRVDMIKQENRTLLTQAQNRTLLITEEETTH